MKRWIGAGLICALGMGGSPSWGQVRERDVTITGPRGRSIERSVRTERGPGFVERQVNVQRPGGSFHSDAILPRGPRPFVQGPAMRGGGYFPTNHWGGGFGPRPFVVERDVVVNRGIGLGPALLGGAGLFGLGLFTGSALSAPPPPPVYVAPPPPPTVVYNPPQPYSPAPPPQATVVVDPVAEATNRLASHHNHSRRDGAITLGRLRDARAVGPLVDRLKNDTSPEVRIAAATALGEIGDPRAMVYLERANVYDKKQAVRDAAAASLSRVPRSLPVAEPALAPGATAVPTQPPIENVPPSPMPEPGFRETP